MNSENNTKSFHALVRIQRKSNSSQTSSLVVDVIKYESPKDIHAFAGWREHFQDLSAPRDTHIFNDQYLNKVRTDLIDIEEIYYHSSQLSTPVTEEEMRKALAKMKNNKAADSFGLMSEHFTYCTDEIVGGLGQ